MSPYGLQQGLLFRGTGITKCKPIQKRNLTNLYFDFLANLIFCKHNYTRQHYKNSLQFRVPTLNKKIKNGKQYVCENCDQLYHKPKLVCKYEL